jgi:hypothetical protein
MTRKCIQCDKAFTISDSELEFFTSKNLSIPKRCKECREKNKANKSNSYSKSESEYRSYYTDNANDSDLAIAVITFIFSVVLLFLKVQHVWIFSGLISLTAFWNFLKGKFNRVYIQEFDSSIYKYTFYDTKSMTKHYVKHGRQTNCTSMEDYLYKTNLVILDKGNLSKLQKKDGDTIYYNPKTKEFVVVAKAGYVRTYFIASDKYYNKQ